MHKIREKNIYCNGGRDKSVLEEILADSYQKITETNLPPCFLFFGGFKCVGERLSSEVNKGA